MVIKGTATLDQLKKYSGEWLTVKALADKLGVHVDTIRRWERIGRITAIRNPMNNYRLFLWSKIVEEVLENEPRCSHLRSSVL